MSFKRSITELHRQHPLMTTKEIACEVGCGEQWVREIRCLCALPIPRSNLSFETCPILKTRARYQFERMIERQSRVFT